MSVKVMSVNQSPEKTSVQFSTVFMASGILDICLKMIVNDKIGGSESKTAFLDHET